MTLRTMLLVLVLTIAIFALAGALFVKGPAIGLYRYRLSYYEPSGACRFCREFYSPVAIPMRYISWVAYKVMPPQPGLGIGVMQHDCLQGYGWHRPKGWN